MDKKSWKNVLQEYCQKNKLEMPKYDTVKIGLIGDNTIIWKSIITFGNYKVDGIDLTKRDAEGRAAALLLNYLEDCNMDKKSVDRKQKIENIQDINLKKYKRIILVDGENCDFSINKLDNNDLVCIFVAKNTSKNIVFEYQDKYDNCYIFISESVGKDAADHLLTFFAGILSVINSEGMYYILTKDHYGEFLEKFMKNCKFICSLDELIKV